MSKRDRPRWGRGLHPGSERPRIPPPPTCGEAIEPDVANPRRLSPSPLRSTCGYRPAHEGRVSRVPLPRGRLLVPASARAHPGLLCELRATTALVTGHTNQKTTRWGARGGTDGEIGSAAYLIAMRECARRCQPAPMRASE
jgi:hypothetical protein